jgi:hypothetical protein
MQIIPVQSYPDMNYYLIGDPHCGAAAFAEKDFDRVIVEIQNDVIARASTMGDMLEGFWLDDQKRFDPETNISSPLIQKKDMKAKLEAIQGKLDTMLDGNHERYLLKKVGQITKDLCDDLKITYGTFASKLEFSDNYKFFIMHGARGINSMSPDPVRKRAYMLFTLQRHLQDLAGDCIVMAKGHAHKLLVSKPLPLLYTVTEKGKIKAKYTQPGSRDVYISPEHRYYACTGSFLKSQMIGVSTYSERFELAPVELGYIKIIIRDKKVQDVEAMIV